MIHCDATFPRIRCAVCSKPVDRIEWHDDRCRDVRIISAYCHGSKDTMELPHAALIQRDVVGQIKNQEGVAFAVARITGGQNESR